MWSIVYVNALAKAEVDGLPRHLRASFERIIAMIRSRTGLSECANLM